MSHVVAIDVKIRDLNALQQACERLGGVLHRGQTSHTWYGTWVKDYHEQDAAYRHGIKPEDYGKCDHAISFAGAKYEIGVVKQEDSYTLVFDFIDYKLIQAVGGTKAEKLVQMYSVEKAKIEARKKGRKVKEEALADGSIKLTITN